MTRKGSSKLQRGGRWAGVEGASGARRRAEGMQPGAGAKIGTKAGRPEVSVSEARARWKSLPEALPSLAPCCQLPQAQRPTDLSLGLQATASPVLQRDPQGVGSGSPVPA